MSPGVLVVEDDPHVRVVLDEVLMDQGLNVWSVGDDLSAYRVLNEEAKHINVLLTDVNLGAGASGFEVARRARSLNDQIEIIYISGFPVAPETLAAEEGVLLTKPLNLATLANMVLAKARAKSAN